MSSGTDSRQLRVIALMGERGARRSEQSRLRSPRWPRFCALGESMIAQFTRILSRQFYSLSFANHLATTLRDKLLEAVAAPGPFDTVTFTVRSP